MENFDVEFVLKDVEVKRKEREMVEMKLKKEFERLVKDLLFEEDLSVLLELIKYYLDFY